MPKAPIDRSILSEDLWSEIASILKCDVNDHGARLRTQGVIRVFGLNRKAHNRTFLKPGDWGQEKERLMLIETSCRELTRELNNLRNEHRDDLLNVLLFETRKNTLDPGVGIASRAGGEWQAFFKHLKMIESLASVLRLSRKRPANNVDAVRDRFWESAAWLYTRETGKEPKVSVGTSGPNARKATGRFVKLIKALTKAVEGERSPSPNAIRGFVRKYKKRSA